LSPRKHSVFLCGELWSEGPAVRAGKTQSKRSGGPRSRIEGPRFAARSAREIGGFLAGHFPFTTSFSNTGPSSAPTDRSFAFTLSFGRSESDFASTHAGRK